MMIEFIINPLKVLYGHSEFKLSSPKKTEIIIYTLIIPRILH